MFLHISPEVSSQVINPRGSLTSVPPRPRNSTANIVFPQPGPPHTMVGRPLGNPPFVTSSNPAIPVRDLSSLVIPREAFPFRFLRIAKIPLQYQSFKF